MNRSKDIDIGRLRKNNDVTRSLAVPIGKNDQGETVLLDIHQKEDGPNGIIFGPAGSGKTEFINTFLISLAMNFSPDDIRFYLVDFNQTSGFDLLSKLPHMTGILVEEKKEAMQRFDRMLKEEFERREELLRQAGVSNAYQYLKKKKDPASDLPPMPHMLIVVDDFKGVKQRQPALASQICSIAKLENAAHYGVHVLYATQNALGVVSDQIHETLNYRICSSMMQSYEVEDQATDAELIFHPGRLYFASPAQDTIQLMQLAFSDVISMPAMKIGKPEQNEFFWQFFHKKQSDALVSAIIRYEMD